MGVNPGDSVEEDLDVFGEHVVERGLLRLPALSGVETECVHARVVVGTARAVKTASSPEPRDEPARRLGRSEPGDGDAVTTRSVAKRCVAVAGACFDHGGRDTARTGSPPGFRWNARRCTLLTLADLARAPAGLPSGTFSRGVPNNRVRVSAEPYDQAPVAAVGISHAGVALTDGVGFESCRAYHLPPRVRARIARLGAIANSGGGSVQWSVQLEWSHRGRTWHGVARSGVAAWREAGLAGSPGWRRSDRTAPGGGAGQPGRDVGERGPRGTGVSATVRWFGDSDASVGRSAGRCPGSARPSSR